MEEREKEREENQITNNPFSFISFTKNKQEIHYNLQKMIASSSSSLINIIATLATFTIFCNWSNAAFLPSSEHLILVRSNTSLNRRSYLPATNTNSYRIDDNQRILTDGHEQQTSRRQLMTSLMQNGSFVAFLSSMKPSVSHAIEGEESSTSEESSSSSTKNRTILQGKIELQSGIILPEDISTSALYITARPNNAVDVPRAILDGSNGKAPPVLAVRFPNVIQFPYEFELSLNDLTLEGSSKISADDTDGSSNNYWWEGKDFIVSARWDTDGIAATRNPTDLVGRSLFAVGSNGDRSVGAAIQLQGRGFTGKLITGGKQK